MYSKDFYGTIRSVKAGEEIFQSYESPGGTEWFTWRKIVPKLHVHEEDSAADSSSSRGGGGGYGTSRSPAELERIGVCLSHTYIAPSSIAWAGRGLFARKAFRKGEVVTVAPAVLFYWEDLEKEAHSSVLENYLVSNPASPRGGPVLFPFSGDVMMANHADAPDASLALRWFDWPTRTAVASLEGLTGDTGGDGGGGMGRSAPSLHALTSSPNAPPQLTLALVALRDLVRGEELTLDYGGNWSAAWAQHRAELGRHREHLDEWGTASERGRRGLLFRRPVLAPPGLFAESWTLQAAQERGGGGADGSSDLRAEL
jgi:hypothetical protein